MGRNARDFRSNLLIFFLRYYCCHYIMALNSADVVIGRRLDEGTV
jgi:hypothetical protein